MTLRPCLTCGTPSDGPRCDQHRIPNRSNWERLRRLETVDAYRMQYGDWCPGYANPPHPATDLTADHITPRSQGGETGPLRVLCMTCNARRGAGPA